MTSNIFTQHEGWLPYELAFVGGYCDAASFVLTKTFTGHVTGNLVLTAIAIAAHDWRNLLAHLAAISAFLLGTVLSMIVMRRLQVWSSSRLLAFLLLIQAFLVASASLMRGTDSFPRLEIFLVLMSLGLGLQNGSFTRAGGIGIHTTYITGVITSLFSAGTKSAAAKSPLFAVQQPSPGPGVLSSIWLFFVVGAGSGAGMAIRFKALGLLGAAGLLGMLALIEVRA